jgi:hypothetical protein
VSLCPERGFYRDHIEEQSTFTQPDAGHRVGLDCLPKVPRLNSQVRGHSSDREQAALVVFVGHASIESGTRRLSDSAQVALR